MGRSLPICPCGITVVVRVPSTSTPSISCFPSASLFSGPENYDIHTRVPGPAGALPLTDEMLRQRASGDLFGWTQDARMGWDPARLGGAEVLLLSTHGGIRAADGTPVALGYHTGHWEVGLLMQAAAEELKAAGAGAVAGVLT